MSIKDNKLEDEILALRDDDFLVFWGAFGPFYKHSFLGALSGFTDIGQEWAFLTMEVIRGVGRTDQLDSVADVVIGPLKALIENLKDSPENQFARQGELALSLMICLLDARLRENQASALIQLFDSVSSRGEELGKVRLEPPTWGRVDWRPFSEREVSFAMNMPPHSDGENIRESQRIGIHSKHVTALYDSGMYHEEDVIDVYVNAGWPKDAANSMARNTFMMHVVRDGTENIRATDAAHTLLGLPSEDNENSEDTASWSPALHKESSFDSQTRRNLNRLAAVIRKGLHAGVALDDMVQRMSAHGIEESCASEFAGLVQKFKDTLERGVDFSMFLKKVDFLDTETLLPTKISYEAKKEIIQKIVQEANDTTVNTRGYVLYLRAFQGDEDIIPTGGFFSKLFGKNTGISYEQLISGLLLKKRGLPFGLMSLNEKLDPTRTEIFRLIPRVQSSNDCWQSDVAGAILSSDLIFIRFDRTPGLSWEVQKAFELAPPERLLIGLPDSETLQGGEVESGEIVAAFRSISTPYLRSGFKWEDADYIWRSTLFVTFSPDWTPRIFSGEGRGSVSKRIAHALDEAIQHMNRFF